MVRCIRTDFANKDFQSLVQLLDALLREYDGPQHVFYAQFNGIQTLQYAIVLYENDAPAGCGAIREFDNDTMEVKRMYVSPAFRNKGFASAILAELERWTKELGYTKCVLETGQKQAEAIALYQKNGYRRIPNYGQYANIENSLCFEKTI